MNAVVAEYAAPLLCGTVDPDDPEKGIEAFRKALEEAGIGVLRDAAQEQYEHWKNAQW